MKLRVYKGTQLISENTIIDLPTGVVAFHMDQNEPKIPAVAVASGSHIYIYKNMRPYFKFTLPTLEIHHGEKDLWTRAGDMELGVLCDGLQNLRRDIGDARLTPRTQKLLMLNDRQEAQAFVDLHKGFPLKRHTVVTCIATLKKSHSDESAVSCLVLGTEASGIYILDPEAFTIMETMSLPAPAAHLSVTGLYDVDFRIVAACRNGTLCNLKRGWATAKTIALLESQAVGLIRREKTITVATMDETLICFSNKGKKLWQLQLPSPAMCIEPIDILARGVQFTAVGLKSNQVLVFNDKHVVDCFTMNDSVSAMKFGKFGREDNSLVLITSGGGLSVKILKRTAQFEKSESTSGPGTVINNNANNAKLNIPKKTKLFVDQTARERENSLLMHRVFQHDLYLMRLNTARAFVSTLESSSNPVTLDQGEPLKLSAQILGLGPVFRLLIGLCNSSSGKPSRNLLITFFCDDKLYSIGKNIIQVPMLVPGLEYVFETLIECVSDLGISDQVRVFITKPPLEKPILSAIINMPVAELI
ncbi:Bardet-Biedl syndrome 1 protein homolog isoform X2 [Tigriopus californicus]|nr:Bardet-Biedl syndrome 1 protein homolog isoform X2 [Tigriopus californicus]